jgi:hypothetical protein
MTTPDPNAGAVASTVMNALAGIDDETGEQLAFDLVAFLQPSQRFSLQGTAPGVTPYPFPEGPNQSSSALDKLTTLAKILTRTYKAADGNVYDVFDMLTLLVDKAL